MNGEYSRLLYEELVKRGYQEDFCKAIAKELYSDFTAKRMLGYLRQYPTLPMTEVVDEMLAILSDRDEWIERKESEKAQQSINEWYHRQPDGDE